MTRRLALAAALLLSDAPLQGAWLSPSGKGRSAAAFLKLPPGGRAAGMGEAQAAAAEDATSVYWNPAALTRIERRSAALMHAAHLGGSSYQFAAFGQSLGRAGAWGLGLQYFSAGKIAQTDAAGNDLGTYAPKDLALTAGYGLRLDGSGRDGAAAGLAVKLVRSEIVARAQTAAVDLGLLSPPLLGERLRLALTASNLGGELRYESASEPLPRSVRLGAACRLSRRWLAALDAALPNDNSPYAALGTEFNLVAEGRWRLAGRAGLNTRTLGEVEGPSGLALGLGAGLDRLTFDYAAVPFGALGLAHRVSLGVSF